MTAGSLATRKDDTHIHALALGLIAGHKLDEGHAIGVWEKFLDSLLVTYTLRGLTLLHLYGTLKAFGQLWLIGSPFSLQKTFFHFTFILCL